MPSAAIRQRLSRIPKVDKILNHPALQSAAASVSRDFLVYIIQKEIGALRESMLSGGDLPDKTSDALLNRIAGQAALAIDALLRPSLHRVINATGVILHTGLGRAPLSLAASEQIAAVSQGYCNLELDLITGKRGDRMVHVEELLCFLTGAEAACVVNNNAAAVLLVLNSLAFGKEAIVSRGQLVEIGGSFRIPEVMEKSGTLMIEIGTTNKTHLRDYENAISAETGLICVVHASNYRIQGFTKEVELKAVTQLARRKNIPVLHDLGGGVLFDFRKIGLPDEPVARNSIAAGTDIVTFSGDKVLGGPQCGVIVGKRKYLARIRSNALMRALRCDKLIIAGMESTLKLFIGAAELSDTNEVIKQAVTTVERLQERARSIHDEVKADCAATGIEIAIVESSAQMGSGAMPLEELPSVAIAMTSEKLSVEQLARGFRDASPPVVGIIKDNRFHLDLKSIRETEDAMLAACISQVLAALASH